MTFEQYMEAVREEQLIGGLSEVGIFVRALQNNRPDLWDQIKGVKFYDPTMDERHMASFLLWVYGNWKKA